MVRNGQEFSMFQFFNSPFFNLLTIFGANTWSVILQPTDWRLPHCHCHLDVFIKPEWWRKKWWETMSIYNFTVYYLIFINKIAIFAANSRSVISQPTDKFQPQHCCCLLAMQGWWVDNHKCNIINCHAGNCEENDDTCHSNLIPWVDNTTIKSHNNQQTEYVKLKN